ncbi:MAG TPA: hypothetical protein VF457_18960, partial [Burkholderiaceae bacterium]
MQPDLALIDDDTRLAARRPDGTVLAGSPLPSSFQVGVVDAADVDPPCLTNADGRPPAAPAR